MKRPPLLEHSTLSSAQPNMRSFLYIILAFSPFICAFPEVDLLLPGIHDQKLQAGILSEVFSISRSKDMSLN
jgi:hypothetical protein